MSVTFNIPPQSRYITTSNIFTAQFNTPTVGVYDFNIAGNTGQKICDLYQNTVYLIDRLTIGGTVSEGDYLESIGTLPLLTLKKKVKNEIVYKLPMPIVQYIDDMDVTAWIIADKGSEELHADFSGVLNQIAQFIGIASISINISYSIYAIESTIFNNAFRGDLSPNIGQSVIGGK